MWKRLLKRWNDWRWMRRVTSTRPYRLNKRDYQSLMEAIESPPRANEKLKEMIRKASERTKDIE